ncbi:Thoeris anti-defense Tad2 family protein [Levilactobacillus spicheri]|uniref:Thoeris anti-defense 2-like domain-containing protein n=1 Tax=Levilactobacillus spicheri TaxID=216463 RepID=A0A0F3RVS0_9LACO|nr:MW1434 family type I TA system toxin [Levilactobacillus spicheri]KJW12852.1 hypothetical protein VC81_06275 [Levilactobacillus spicheri]KJW13601.1 hypothetical protein VC81_03835 [Levilactobacillus spicheri]
MRFSKALDELYSGKKMRRKSWKKMDYLFVSDHAENENNEAWDELFDHSKANISSLMLSNPKIIIKNPKGHDVYTVWNLKQEDLLAEDWEHALQVTPRIDGATPDKLELHFIIDNKCIYSPDEMRRSLHEATDKIVDDLVKGVSEIGQE